MSGRGVTYDTGAEPPPYFWMTHWSMLIRVSYWQQIMIHTSEYSNREEAKDGISILYLILGAGGNTIGHNRQL